ncbi:MAG: chromate efflux transporter [Neomegalonema sp.]|nr:chromate efflux transporter [Neomegalonema sp.]
MSEAKGPSTPQTDPSARDGFWTIFGIFLRLGLTSFGGPVAHLGYFREAFVERRGWMSDRLYADLVALCQFMPGPASSQVGFAIGLLRGGGWGGLAAWAGFTLPSALALIAIAYGLDALGSQDGAGWLQGLKAMAVAVVAQAVLGMARSLTPDAARASLAVVAAAMALFIPGITGQLIAIGVGAIVGLTLLRGAAAQASEPFSAQIPRPLALLCLAIFTGLLFGLPLLAAQSESGWLAALNGYFRAGALVFGGGHVVLPLLQADIVGEGWVSADAFIAGYGAAQAVPGPLFTFAAFLGAASEQSPNGLIGGLWALIAIFLSTPLLVIGLLPFWQDLRQSALARAALTGVNAAVVGLLLAALYDPVFTLGITQHSDLIIAMASFVALTMWKVPVWLVVPVAALVGAAVPFLTPLLAL